MDKQFKNDMSIINQCGNLGTQLQCVLVQFVKCLKFDITIRHVPEQLLQDGWFNDEIINIWGKLLNEKINKNKYSQTVIFNTQLFGKLMILKMWRIGKD